MYQYSKNQYCTMLIRLYEMLIFLISSVYVDVHSTIFYVWDYNQYSVAIYNLVIYISYHQLALLKSL